PYNLLGPKLMDAIAAELAGAQAAGSRAIILRSGLRHFCTVDADRHQHLISKMSSSPALRPTRLDKTGGTAWQFLSHSRRRQRGRIFYGADQPVNELDPGSSITLT